MRAFGCSLSGKAILGERTMKKSFKEVLQTLVDHRIEAGEDPQDLFEELLREANLVFGHYNLEYELGLFTKTKDTESP
jgi:hypothetical protein